MTQDFKNQLQAYLFGNADDPGAPIIDEPQFQEPITTSNSIQAQIGDALGYGAREYESVLISGNIVSNFNNFILFYGKTPMDTTTNKQENFIAVFNSENKLIYITKKFDSGSDLYTFLCLKEDENGYIYGLSYDNNTARVVLLNKILMAAATGSNSVKLRKTYIVGYDIKSSYILGTGNNNDLISKVKGSAIYFIVDETSQVIRFTINFGAENEWLQKNLTITLIPNYYVYTQKTEDGSKCYIFSYQKSTYHEQEIGILSKTTVNNDLSTSSEVFELTDVDMNYSSIDVNASIINENNIYLSLYIIKSGEMFSSASYIYHIYIIDQVVNTELILSSTSERYSLFKCNDLTLVEKEAGEGTNTIFFGIIVNNSVYFNTYKSTEGIVIALNVIIKNKYNLVEIQFDGRAIYGNRYNIQLVYNSSNYNGLSYSSPNSLVPNSAVLKDSSDKIIFARNIYNKIIQGATTSSIVQIPNTLLNDLIISNEELYSITNLQTNDNTEEITKNIYETLNINFNNTISVLNNNDTDNPIQMLKASEYVNKNISSEDTSGYHNYGNQFIRWFRFNYTDGTSLDEDISQNITYKGLVATINIKFYAKKDTNSIDILSNDKSMAYSIINANLRKGHYYNIMEDIRIS